MYSTLNTLKRDVPVLPYRINAEFDARFLAALKKKCVTSMRQKEKLDHPLSCMPRHQCDNRAGFSPRPLVVFSQRSWCPCSPTTACVPSAASLRIQPSGPAFPPLESSRACLRRKRARGGDCTRALTGSGQKRFRLHDA